MANLPKLVLVPGSGHSHKMARKLCKRLTTDFRLPSDLVKLVSSHGRAMGKEKSSKDPLLVGQFDGGEIDIRSGDELLQTELQYNHVAFVQNAYQPTTEKSVNDFHFELRGFFDRLVNLPILKRTAVLPYMPYLRSHSVEKYAAIGHIEFNSLKMIVNDYHGVSLDDLICLDPHSSKGREYARALGMEIHGIHPFQSANSIFWCKQGFKLEEEDLAHKVTEQQQPFVNEYNRIKDDYDLVVVVCPDDGGEERSQRFLLDLGLKKKHIAFIKKRRIKDGEVEISGFKGFSPIKHNEEHQHILDFAKQGLKVLYIIPDDMVCSGGTVNDIASYIKDIVKDVENADELVTVESWTTHAECAKPEKIRKRTAIDRFVCLDTIEQNTDEVPITYIGGTDILLAASLYKSYYQGVERFMGPEGFVIDTL